MGTDKRYDIAIIFPDWYAFLHDAMEGVLEIRGIRRHCHFRNFISKDFSQAVDFPKGYRPDGIIVSYDADHMDAPWLEELDIPVVNIFSSTNRIFPTVGVCPVSMAQTIVEHFSTLGFQTLGITGTIHQTHSSPVHQHIIEECTARGMDHWYVEVPDGIHAGAWHMLEEHAPDLKEKLLLSSAKTGVYTVHDMRGRLVADYCTELGIKVPEQVGILGRFDSINARLCTPELSSIVMPARQIGGQAIQLLIQLIDGSPVDELYPMVEVHEVRVRESTVGKSDPDMIALQARTIIREKACKGLTVDELIQSLPLARSTFEKRYRALTGSSPAQEIRKIRVEKARQLLLTSKKTIDEIAYEVGFTDPRPFVVFFKREVGETPGGFRKAYVE
ncbi:substrate-binding domain-containing protein [Verrucomicrobiaceae bacterium N1E253]|uniref:Substrate-binding domain-containing protein n=1 Tax=Oceaniferula marina TaxID=2748318 RepID=A0A851GDL0_9BACT|nr:substrate-binding domain-containing protein [Oceaniferula marina]NWK55848.1 substrate-binding domain-containing protein [Oceaniferula marina]